MNLVLFGYNAQLFLFWRVAPEVRQERILGLTIRNSARSFICSTRALISHGLHVLGGAGEAVASVRPDMRATRICLRQHMIKTE